MRLVISAGPNLPVPALRGGAVNRFWSDLAPALVRRGAEVTICARAYRGQPQAETREGVRYLRHGGFDAGRSRAYNYIRSLAFAVAGLWRLPKSDLYISNDAFSPWILALRGRARRTLVAVGRAPKGQFRFYPRTLNLAVPTRATARAVAAESEKVGARCTVLPYAIDTACFHARVGDGDRSSGNLRFLYAGRIHPEKGLDLLLQAFRQFAAPNPAARLLIVGPYRADQGGAGSEFRTRLMAESADLPVEWMEPVFEPEQLANIYRSCAWFVYPSLAEAGETFGLAPLEAMACGAVPIVSALACFEDFIVDGVNGIQFDHRSADPEHALTTALCRVMSAPVAKMREAAQSTAQQFGMEPIADRWYSALLQLHQRCGT